MKRLSFALLAVAMAAGSGCCAWSHPWPGHQETVDSSFSEACPDCPAGCFRCGFKLPGGFQHGMNDKHKRWGRGFGLHKGYDCHCNCPRPHNAGTDYLGPGGGLMPAPGMSAAQVAYPYYTNRGPRDFLDPNPPRLGP